MNSDPNSAQQQVGRVNNVSAVARTGAQYRSHRCARRTLSCTGCLIATPTWRCPVVTPAWLCPVATPISGRDPPNAQPCRDTKSCVATPNGLTHVATPRSVSRHQGSSPCSFHVVTPRSMSRHPSCQPGHDTKLCVVTLHLLTHVVHTQPMSFAQLLCRRAPGLRTPSRPSRNTTCYVTTQCWKWAIAHSSFSPIFLFSFLFYLL